MAQSKLLSKIRTEARRRNYSYPKEQAYIGWMVRYVYYHDLKHPKDLREPEVVAYLNHLVINREVSAVTQDQARSAIHFFYRHVIGEPLNHLEGLEFARDANYMRFAM